MRIGPFIAFLLLAVAGCGGPERPVFTVSNWGGAGDDSEYDKLVNDIIREFGEQNGCLARAEGIPREYVSKMILNHVAGTMPDVMTLDASSAAIFIDNGVLEDLTPYIERERASSSSADGAFSLDDYWPNAVNVARRGEKIYAIPGDFTPMVVYYNKDLFDAAGVPYPRRGWSFQDFLETARKLTNPAKGQYGFYFQNWMAGWIMWLWNNGGDVLSSDGKRALGTLDSPQNVETFGFIRSLITEHKVAPVLSEVAAMGVDPFANGQAAMAISGHWAMIGYKNAPNGPDGRPRINWQRLGVVEMPHNTPESHTVMYEAGFAIPVKAKRKDLAWKYIKLWTAYDLQLRYNQSGIAIDGRKDVAMQRAGLSIDGSRTVSSTTSAAEQEIERQFLEIVPSARPPYGSWIEGYEVVETIGKNAMDAILNNQRDIKSELTKAAKLIELEFAKK